MNKGEIHARVSRFSHQTNSVEVKVAQNSFQLLDFDGLL